MKILRIGIYNINSLVGRQEIDFRVEPLRSAGLYAIVGPTGAGKSTILDAVTLALYGKTERDGTGSEVMSHGTGECFAEVEYQAAGGTYLSRWERRRSRQKPDGNLQTAQRQLSKWNAEAGEYQPLAADRLAEVNDLTVEVVGLDYERFVRSVMLTQGQFARFLHSSLKERADVLEKITGTEIYSRISEAAFERHKEARTHYDRLKESQGHSLPLPEDERKVLETELAAVKEGAEHLRTRQQAAREGTLAHKKRDDLLARREELRQQSERTRRTEEELAPVHTALAESLRLLPLRGPLAKRKELREAGAGEEQAVKELLNRQQFVAARVAEDRKTARKAEINQADFVASKPRKLEALNKATDLENTVMVLGRETDQQALQLVVSKRAREETYTQLVAGTRRRDQLVAELGTEDVASIGNKLEQSEAKLEALQQEQTRLTTWKQRLSLEAQIVALKAEASQHATALAVATEASAGAGERVNQAEKAVESRRRILRRVEQSKGLEQLRSETRPGEPCLLCGSLHHPALEDHEPVTDQDILIAGRDLQLAREQLEAARQDVVKSDRVVQSASTQVAVCNSNLAQLQQQLEGVKGSGQPPASLDVALQALVQLEGERIQCADVCRQLRLKRSGVEALLTLQPQIEVLKKELEQREAADKKLESEGMARAREVARLTQLKAELIGPGSTQHYRAAMEQSEAAIRKAWTHAQQALEKGEGELRLAEELLTIARKRLGALREAERTVNMELSGLLQELRITSAEEAAATLLDPATEEDYRSRLHKVEVDRQAQETAGAELKRALVAADAAVSGIPARELLEQEVLDLEEAASRLNQQRGGIEKLIEQDEQRRSVHALLLEELTRAELELNRWARLNDLIGQQTGVKFSRFAQTLTLQRLVEVGNLHLHRISERYRMRHKAAAELGRENLELEIIDTYQNDNQRPMSTLSGGETFLVSLALALGLSDLASGRTNIQTLFIDEGFGTLDERVLDQAVSALEQLEHHGKTIGLISHVRELRERIHCQIQLSARGNGRSQLEVTTG